MHVQIVYGIIYTCRGPPLANAGQAITPPRAIFISSSCCPCMTMKSNGTLLILTPDTATSSNVSATMRELKYEPGAMTKRTRCGQGVEC